MIPTSAQLALLRGQPHRTKLYLSIYQPSTVFAARLNNASAAKNDRVIPYDGVSAGAYTLIQSGMTLYVGSSAGAFDKGMVRVRSADGTNLTVAENAHINWADDDYLTVVSFFEINAVYPRIIQDPADAMNTLWYKDYDIAYSNQNSILGSFIQMGPHHAGFVGDVYYSATGTTNLLGNSLTYSWFFEGADTTGSSAIVPGNIHYTTPGHYTTRLTVTDGASTDISYRHISIYNRGGTIQNWELLNLSGSRGQGGYTASIRLHQTLTSAQLREGSLVVIFAEDDYAGQSGSMGGNAIGREDTVFCGYVLKGSIRYNYRESSMEFELGSPAMVMQEAEGFGVSIQYSDAPGPTDDIPSGWVTVLGMDVKRALYHYLRWHSTVLMTNDFQFVGTDRYLQYFDADRTSLYDAIQNAMHSILLGGVVCDRQGKIWAERPVYLEPSAFSEQFTLTNVDWVGEAGIEELRMARTAFIEAGGIYFSGPANTYTPLLAQAPGTTPGYRGSVERIQGLALTGQSELNQITGDLYAQRNATYPEVSLDLRGNYRVLDIAPQERVPMTVAAADTVRGITFAGKHFFVSRMEWQYDSMSEILLSNISLSEIASGADAETLVIPNVPDIPGTGDGGGYDQGGIEVPDLPQIPIPTINLGTTSTFALWVPLLVANVGGVQRYPTETADGGILLSPSESAAVDMTVGFPRRSYATCEVVFIWQEVSSVTTTFDGTVTAYATPGAQADQHVVSSESYPASPAGAYRHSLSWELSWAADSVGAVNLNMDISAAGLGGSSARLFGFYLVFR